MWFSRSVIGIMIKKTLTSLILAATLAFTSLTGCTKQQYPIKYGTQKEEVCDFRTGRELSIEVGAQDSQFWVGAGLSNPHSKTNWKAGVATNFQSIPGLNVSKEKSSLAISPNNMVLGHDGIYFDFFQQRFCLPEENQKVHEASQQGGLGDRFFNQVHLNPVIATKNLGIPGNHMYFMAGF